MAHLRVRLDDFGCERTQKIPQSLHDLEDVGDSDVGGFGRWGRAEDLEALQPASARGAGEGRVTPAALKLSPEAPWVAAPVRRRAMVLPRHRRRW